MSNGLRLVGLTLFLLALSAQAQQIPATRNPATNFIFRMSHLEGSEGSCVLVQEDGKFHLERLHRKSVLVFEGALSSDRLAELHTLLNDDRFQQLLPEAVSSSLLPSGLDELVISVPREGRWMNLRFLSGLSSNRNRPLLNRFLKWNDGVFKNSNKKLNEQSGRNNCLPPGQIELEQRSNQGTKSP